MAKNNSNKLDYLQVFRALAAGGVALAHMAETVSGQHPVSGATRTLSWFSSLNFGVDIFFVISGFIMIYTTRNVSGGAVDARAFLGRRLIRIVPVYWFYTTLVLLLAFVRPSALHHLKNNALYIINSYLFIPVPRMEDGGIYPVLGLGWTLNYEMFFYVVFALLLLAPRRYLLLLLSSFFVILVLASGFIGRAQPALWFWTRSNILEFLYGATIAQMYLSSVKIPPWISLIAIVIGIVGWQVTFGYSAGFAENPDVRGFVYGIPASLLFLSIALCPGARNAISSSKWLAPIIAIGDSSYSLYLSHIFVARFTILIIPPWLFGAVYPGAYVLITFLLAIGVAQLSYIWFENPIHSWGRSLFTTKRAVG